MGRPTSSKPFLLQPTYQARIDPSHPIGRKVTAGFSAHYGAAVRITDLISGFPSTVASGALNSVTAGTVGKAFRPSTTSSGVYWSPPSVSPYCDGSLDFSIELLLTFIASDAQFSRLLDCGGTAGGVGGTGGWDIEIDFFGNGLGFVGWATTTPTLNPIVSMTAGRTYHVVITQKSGLNSPVLYVNGQLVSSTSSNLITTANTAKFFYATYRTAGDLSAAGTALHFARMYQGTIITPSEVKRLYEKPFEMFGRPKRIFSNTLAAGGITGNAAWTEAQDAWAISGSVRIDGSAAWTESQDTWAISGTVGNVTGSVAWTEIQDSWVGAGQTGVFAAAAWTEAQDAWNVVATLGVFGTASWTEGQDSWNATGTVSLPSVTGDVAWTEVQDLWNIQGSFGAQGGHFIPLTRKQEQALRKRERREREEQEAEWAQRNIDADTLAAEIRSQLLPSKTIAEVINEVETSIDYDDDEESDLEMLLLA